MDKIRQRLLREGGDSNERLTVDEVRLREVRAATHVVFTTVSVTYPEVANPNEAKHGVRMDVASFEQPEQSEPPQQSNIDYINSLTEQPTPVVPARLNVVPANLDQHVEFDPHADIRQQPELDQNSYELAA